MFADITGQNGLLLNMLDMASHYQLVFPVADKNPLTVVSRLVFLSVSGSIWEVSLNHHSVNWLSKLGASSCQRPQCRRSRNPHVSMREERGSTAHDVWWTSFNQVERLFDKTVALCSLELVDEHSNRRQRAQSKSMCAWPILASPFSALVSCITQLASHQRHRDDFAFQRRVAMLAEAQRSIISTRVQQSAQSLLFWPVLEVLTVHRHRSALQSGTKSCVVVETFSAKVSGRCVGWVQGSSVGTKVLQTCGLVIAMPLSGYR